MSKNSNNINVVDDASEFVLVAGIVLQGFDQFYFEFLDVPKLAKLAFEQRNFSQSLKLSANRLQLYSNSIKKLSDKICQRSPTLAINEVLWNGVESAYRNLIEGRYAGDLALAYFQSVRRKIYKSEWRSEDYSILRHANKKYENRNDYIAEFNPGGNSNLEIILRILQLESYSIPFSNMQTDAKRILDRLEEKFDLYSNSIKSIEMFKAGFYRNKGAYLVGRLNLKNIRRPFIIALLNSDKGIYVDALITSTTFAHNMFSSTLANFHVTTTYYHELCVFLNSIMPLRPLGMHYSTIGYNHLGKVAVMMEIENEINTNLEKFGTAAGMKGTVAIGFSSLNCSYCLKVIRNTPTKDYKWGDFEGINNVLSKYKRVHEINRTDSMLDSIIYYNLRLRKTWFTEELLEELLEFASDSVIDDNDFIIFRYLIVQRKLTPLPNFLENASQKSAENVIKNLGYCIKNNSAANIFNKDLDVRNYGVTSYSKVYLYDYDALEKLIDVKIRTNLDRYDGEEDIPEWFFESGVVFLPEEIIAGLCLPQRVLRNLFAQTHQELLSVEYWLKIQNDLHAGHVPSISVYPDTEKLH